MNFKKQLHNIKKQLLPHREIWNSELLNNYPTSLTQYPAQWIEELKGLNADQLWKFDGQKDYSSLEGTTLYHFILENKELTRLPQQQTAIELPPLAFTKITGKKRHEILAITQLIYQLREKVHFSHLVDIGGGVGHLARILSQNGGIKVIALDKDSTLQTIGKKTMAKYRPPAQANSLEFIKAELGKQKIPSHVFTPTSFSIGLHTCGGLAIEHFKHSIANKEMGLINFGCCYPKLDPNCHLNISNAAKQDPLLIGEFGLTLATRSHASMSFNQFWLKQRVKYYRYALHLLLHHQLDIKQFIPLGNSKPALYRQDFAQYAKDNLARINIKHHFSDLQLNQFYQQKQIQQQLNEMFLANQIRWQFGRLLEFYILTDRCQYLCEQQFHVTMQEYFTQDISPRNIGILALRNG